jgi:gluconate 2-dehydrogenase gamma chain
MTRPSSLNRRKFLTTTAAVAAGTAAGCSASKSPWRFLTDNEALALTAICEQIIPADDTPGAAWANVVVYIDRQLTRKFKEHRQAYRDGIAAADRMAGGSFAGADAGKQLATLRQMEKNKATKPFFELVVTHTMQGFYGNPRHGGNREYASWRMLGVPSTPARGRDQYDFTKVGRS